MQILIGIDWSENHHCVCIMNTAGAQLSLFEIAHTPKGFARLEAEVEKLGLAPRLLELYAHLQRPVPEPDPVMVLAYQEQTPWSA